MCHNYHVIALDQRGRGDSDWAKDGDYTTAAFVADLAGFSEALNLDSFILAGLSLGGRNSIDFTALYPDRVQKLIIVDIGPIIDPRGGDRIRQEMIAVPEEFDSFEAVVAYMSKENIYASDAVLRRRLQYATRELPNGKIGWRYDVAVRDESRQAAQEASTHQLDEVWLSLKKITCPTLIVRGANSDILSLDAARQMVDAVSDSRLEEVQRAGHMVFEDNPDGFLAAVRSFLG